MQRKKHDNPFSFRAPVELGTRLDKYADKLGVDRSSIIKMALTTWLDRMDEIDGRLLPDLISRNCTGYSRREAADDPQNHHERIMQRVAENPRGYGEDQEKNERGNKII